MKIAGNRRDPTLTWRLGFRRDASGDRASAACNGVGGVGIESPRDTRAAWLRSRLSQVNVEASALGCRATFSRIAPVGMFRQLVQCLRIGSRVLADQAQQVKILFRRLLDKFFQHFRLCIRA